ncbi:hypothetical protein BB559_004751 [Furculomyces boomerangus]|uniref:Signal recognition particle receptor subunit beta n=2 Tax=Harpellales TaxID=61421 RepID=A0A2T9YCS8_9FUNG|nr:hypothetical protein BB559_004751 [Furculomyces boomerangus]PVZ99231.1 hypothetical protein BB558_004740 [Smittium angustum]
MNYFEIFIWVLSFAIVAFLLFTVLNHRVDLSFVFGGAGKKKNGILILGLPDSGKTTIWAWFRYTLVLPTQTSMKVNEEEIPVHLMDKTVNVFLTDIPGNIKLRHQFIQYLPICKGIMFVVDSSKIDENYQEVSEYLYDVLTSTQVFEQKIPIAIICNKRDDEKSIKGTEIKLKIEDELNHLRSTRTLALDSHDDNGSYKDDIYLGIQDEKFEFLHIPNQVAFIETSFQSSLDKSPVLIGHSELSSWVIDRLE